MTSSIAIPAQVQASLTAWDCQNSPGPWIQFEGGGVLVGASVEMVFRNNINKDVHTIVEDVEVVTAIEANATITSSVFANPISR